MHIDWQTIYFIMAIIGLVSFILGLVIGVGLARPRYTHREGREAMPCLLTVREIPNDVC